jgi:sarcosine oxidase
MNYEYDTIVVGLGAMGSASVYQLAKMGVSVLGIDQYASPHGYGSSHGDTRITREAIGEGDHFIPLARRSHELWRDIEKETGEMLFVQSGLLMLSSDAVTVRNHGTDILEETIRAARVHGILHTELTNSDLCTRYPQLNFGNEKGYYEPGAGYLRPEACVRAQLTLAQKYGADIHAGERMDRYVETDSGVVVYTDRGMYRCKNLIIAAGPWVGELLGDRYLDVCKVYRQVLYWFDIEPEYFERYVPERFPAFVWALPGDGYAAYGFPALDGPRGGFKIATESLVETTSPQTLDGTVHETEKEHMFNTYIKPYFKGVTSTCLRAEVCMYTVMPDFGFVIDHVPNSNRVIAVSACSGHGFKHSPAIGEMVAHMVQNIPYAIDAEVFSIGRYM